MQMATKTQACEYLGVSASTLRRLERRGLIRSQTMPDVDQRKFFVLGDLEVCKHAYQRDHGGISMERWNGRYQRRILIEMDRLARIGFLCELTAGPFRNHIYRALFPDAPGNMTFFTRMARQLAPRMFESVAERDTEEIAAAFRANSSLPLEFFHKILNEAPPGGSSVLVYDDVYTTIKFRLDLA